MRRLRHGWVNWRRSSNRHITRAPLLLLTGAGASVPLGVGAMGLPPSLTLASGETFSPLDLVPGHLRHEGLDLEGLMIITQVAASLPPAALHAAVAPTGLRIGHARVALIATISMLVPSLAGGRMLSGEMIESVTLALAERDHRAGGGFVEDLYRRLRLVLLERCRALRAREVVPLWGPLLQGIHELLTRRPGGRATLPVFTTNYDTTFEELAAGCRALPFPCDVFLPNEPHPSQWGWRFYDPEAYARYRRPDPPRLTLVVFHLHGSVAWQCAEFEGKPRMAVADHPDTHRMIDDADHRARGMLFPDALKVSYQKDVRPLVELFAPASRERHDLHPDGAFHPMALNYLYFEKCLRHARALLAIGYSFRDADGRDLLLGARRRRGAPDLVLLDPRPEPVVARLGGAASWIRTVPSGFGSGQALEEAVRALDRSLPG